jgi:hypothetical protein
MYIIDIIPKLTNFGPPWKVFITAKPGAAVKGVFQDQDFRR